MTESSGISSSCSKVDRMAPTKQGTKENETSKMMVSW